MDWGSIETWRLIEMWSSLAVNAWVILSGAGLGIARLLGQELTARLVTTILGWAAFLVSILVGMMVSVVLEYGIRMLNP